MFDALRSAFGDPSHEQLVAAAKAILTEANAPLQEQAAALERLAFERDSESKQLILSCASAAHMHMWLQQVAGEAVASMIQAGSVLVAEASSLTPVALDSAVALLEVEADARLREIANELRLAVKGAGNKLSHDHGEA